jgi:hypothetical protein
MYDVRATADGLPMGEVLRSDHVHDRGDDLLTADGLFAWMGRPHLIRPQCSFNSVLDFVFVAEEVRWRRASSEILAAQESYCPDDNTRSDHRPVLALLDLTPDGQPSARQLLLAQIRRMEERLNALEALVEQMPQ